MFHQLWPRVKSASLGFHSNQYSTVALIRGNCTEEWHLYSVLKQSSLTIFNNCNVTKVKWLNNLTGDVHFFIRIYITAFKIKWQALSQKHFHVERINHLDIILNILVKYKHILTVLIKLKKNNGPDIQLKYIVMFKAFLVEGEQQNKSILNSLTARSFQHSVHFCLLCTVNVQSNKMSMFQIQVGTLLGRWCTQYFLFKSHLRWCWRWCFCQGEGGWEVSYLVSNSV